MHRPDTSEQTCPARSTPSVFSVREFSQAGELEDLLQAGCPKRILADSSLQRVKTPLSKESRLLTTFVTPFGRLCLNRLPFGICSASELFQRTVSEILADVEGAICHTDDILSHAADQTTRDSIGRQVLRKLSDAGLTLTEKCECSKEAITFLVHIHRWKRNPPRPREDCRRL